MHARGRDWWVEVKACLEKTERTHTFVEPVLASIEDWSVALKEQPCLLSCDGGVADRLGKCLSEEIAIPYKNVDGACLEEFLPHPWLDPLLQKFNAWLDKLYSAW